MNTTNTRTGVLVCSHGFYITGTPVSPVLMPKYTKPPDKHGITLLRTQKVEEPHGLEMPNRYTERQGRVLKMGAEDPSLSLDVFATWEATNIWA